MITFVASLAVFLVTSVAIPDLPPTMIATTLSNTLSGRADAATTSIYIPESDFFTGASSPDPVGGPLGPGTMANDGVSNFVVPRDYEGNIAFHNAGYEFKQDESLIEFSFKYQGSIYKSDIDISYV
ncbi:hypothetical protein PWT90_09743 [Aphanocladium album]|nr:hypothetical protein PWT90_09743 [Aphanocladium album]